MKKRHQTTCGDLWKHTDRKPMGCSKNSSKREVYADTSLPQRNKRNLKTFHLREKEQIKPKVRNKESIKIRAEISELEIKKNRNGQWNWELVLREDKLNG